MSSEPDKRALLDQLRIDRSASPAAAPTGRRTWLIAGGLALAVLLAAGAWRGLAGSAALAVHPAAARAVSGGAANASVLDATGYVTARREATVSAQITGTVAAVLMEEGDHVRQGQVIGG